MTDKFVPIQKASESERKQQKKVGDIFKDIYLAFEVASDQLNELDTTGKISGIPVTHQIIADHVAKTMSYSLSSAEYMIRMAQLNLQN